MDEQQKFKSWVRDLFEQVSTSAELETRLSMMAAAPRGYKIWTQIAYMSDKLDLLMSKRHYRIHQKRTLKDGGVIVHLVQTVGRKRKTRLDGHLAFLPSSHRNIYRVVGLNNPAFWHKVGSRFIERCYPYLVRIFFKQEELRRVLVAFEESLASRFEMSVTDSTLKEKRQLVQKSTRRIDEFDSERRWALSSISKAFESAADRRQWFKSIRLNLRNIGGKDVAATVRVTKHGLVAQDHLYDLSMRNLFPNLEGIAFSKTELFANRGLKERDYLPAKPVAIDYPVDVFDERSNVRRLAAALKAYPNSSKAIYHGNPYLHMSLADFIDGSSFEIWVLSPRRIILVPQARASVASHERLVSYVFEKFKEGEAREYSNG